MGDDLEMANINATNGKITPWRTCCYEHTALLHERIQRYRRCWSHSEKASSKRNSTANPLPLNISTLPTRLGKYAKNTESRLCFAWLPRD
ncbi:hypothetical protein KIN20_000442 [Parelaphostrongylus tenuis]|uniref:Uncharacterized protein n=1 Tax=Parelaphostrongylus tenuis TaxID=148309 RepID=A0AAD5QBH9_PARTN|nr:hypothetical protein KIN20_000442 [Parelaphostrongylus tenuis]